MENNIFYYNSHIIIFKKKIKFRYISKISKAKNVNAVDFLSVIGFFEIFWLQQLYDFLRFQIFLAC